MFNWTDTGDIMKLLSPEEIANIIGVSTKTIRRAVIIGMPVAKVIASKRGGKPKTFFTADDVKNWYIHEKPGTSTAKYILENCPPSKIEKLQKEKEMVAQSVAVEYQRKAEEESRKITDELNRQDIDGSDLQSMQARLCDLERSSYRLYKEYITGTGSSPSIAEVLEKSYTRIATRRQSFEEKLPKILIEKGLAANTDIVAQVISRVFITLASQMDQLGTKLASKCEHQDSLTIKSIVDSEMSNLRRSVQEGLRGYIIEHA